MKEEDCLKKRILKEEQKVLNELKYCSKCGRWLLPENFYHNPTTKDGLGIYCKDCRREYAKQYYQDHKKEILNKAKGQESFPFSKFIKKNYPKNRIIMKRRRHRIEWYEFLFGQPLCKDDIKGVVSTIIVVIILILIYSIS